MANVKLDITGLKDIQDYLKKAPEMNTIVPEVTLAMRFVHNTLERRVGEVYNAPTSLDSVMRGRSLSPSEQSASTLKYGLQYNNKPIPLVDFPYTETNVSVNNGIPFNSNGTVHYQPVNKARVVKVEVRKGGAFKKKVDGRRKVFPTFFGTKQDGTKFLAKRGQKATWEKLPTGLGTKDGMRDDYLRLKAPSLAWMAETLFKYDTEVQKAVDNVLTVAVNELAKKY
jgi:hypothetical protein